ncbi:MAG: ABC transporter ATP-binding protein [Bdellovibrionales bacterium]|nr:ABC transporter ATP-binding protein [Bdellovibrionales bacterium]MBT3527273.1 ABC transporter ATP-binding protein [Bdellovibrionales bacterium]MBT7668281.1 ABC transporter ATP-binding protein [Bdellovibrionales bacterium]
MIEVKDVTKRFEQTVALQSVSLEMHQGEQYAIRGASGSGKSTLLYLLGGLDTPSSGEITIMGNCLQQMDDQQLAKFRNRMVGFVFQFHFLLPSMNSIDNIYLPAKIAGVKISTIKSDVEQLAERLGVVHCLKKYPYQLSGGEQQRVNLIRALSLKPALLLCDEPTGNLDSQNSSLVTSILIELAGQFGATLVVVTHDDQVASHFSRSFWLQDGAIIR